MLYMFAFDQVFCLFVFSVIYNSKLKKVKTKNIFRSVKLLECVNFGDFLIMKIKSNKNIIITITDNNGTDIDRFNWSFQFNYLCLLLNWSVVEKKTRWGESFMTDDAEGSFLIVFGVFMNLPRFYVYKRNLPKIVSKELFSELQATSNKVVCYLWKSWQYPIFNQWI